MKIGDPSCLYVAARGVDEAVAGAFFEAVRPSEISLLEVFQAQGANRERLLKHYRDRVKAATYEVRLAEKCYRAVDPGNRLVASELEKSWEEALRYLSEAKDTAERFEREHQKTALDPALREQLADFGLDLHRFRGLFQTEIGNSVRKGEYCHQQIQPTHRSFAENYWPDPIYCATHDESLCTNSSCSASLAANSAGVRYPSAPCGLLWL